MDGKDSIILIGPMKTGKTTIALKLLKKYAYNFVNCDNYFDYYYRKTGKPKRYYDDLLKKNSTR